MPSHFAFAFPSATVPWRHLLIGSLAAFCASTALAQGDSRAESRPESSPCLKLSSELNTLDVCPVLIPPIAQVQMDSPAAPAPAKNRKGEDCTTFQPSLAAIHRFWASAGQISGMDYMNALDVSSCDVGGTLTLQDGRKGRWSVNAARKGRLSIEGEPEEKTLYLFCPGCHFAPFWDWNTDKDFRPADR